MVLFGFFFPLAVAGSPERGENEGAERRRRRVWRAASRPASARWGLAGIGACYRLPLTGRIPLSDWPARFKDGPCRVDRPRARGCGRPRSSYPECSSPSVKFPRQRSYKRCLLPVRSALRLMCRVPAEQAARDKLKALSLGVHPSLFFSSFFSLCIVSLYIVQKASG